MSRTSLFNSIHDGRPERLAQLLLGHALLDAKAEPGIRSLLGVPQGDDVVVELERGDQLDPRRGWRADIAIKWPGTLLRVELKIGAGLTVAQSEAIRSHAMDVLVVPSSRMGEYPTRSVKVLSWSELAGAVNDSVLKNLLHQANDANDWWRCIEVTDESVREEFDSFTNGGLHARWYTLYRFLTTLDSHLMERDEYQPSRGWSTSRHRPYPYYGYKFTWDSSGGSEHECRSAWVGFERRDGENVRFRMYENRESEDLPLTVADARARILERFLQR